MLAGMHTYHIDACSMMYIHVSMSGNTDIHKFNVATLTFQYV